MNMPNPQFLMPFFPPQMQEPDRRVNQAPVRVVTAMEFLRNLTNKTESQFAVNGMTIEEIPGQKLTDEEMIAQATACNLLNDYFGGRLKADEWEKAAQAKSKPTIQLPCPKCLSKDSVVPGEVCELCHGVGTIVAQII